MGVGWAWGWMRGPGLYPILVMHLPTPPTHPLRCREQVPHVVSDFWWFYAIINALLAALYMLQLSWMWSIVRCAAAPRRATLRWQAVLLKHRCVAR